MADQTLWGIHAGRTGDADSLFRKKGVIALGWSRFPDLSKLAATRDEFKRVMAQQYPEKAGGAIPTTAGQLFLSYRYQDFDSGVAKKFVLDPHGMLAGKERAGA